MPDVGSLRCAMKPKTPTVLGVGRLADAMRAQIAADPDRYRPETWSIDPVGKCPCCDELVYRCSTRHTGFEYGFATHTNVVHDNGCCCVAPNWGPKHKKQRRKARSK